MIVANDDENHTSGAGLKEEVCAESANDGLDVGERRWRLRLRESRHEGQYEQEYKQGAREFSVAHSRLQFLGYRTERLFEDRNDPLFLRVAKLPVYRRSIQNAKASWSGTIRLREDAGFRYRLLTADPVRPTLHPVVARVHDGGSPLMEIV
jgi:hypothetical protein